MLTKTNKDKAEENLRYATIGFDSGVVASSVVMEAQTAWLKANSEDVDARIEVKLCQLYLQKAIGNLKQKTNNIKSIVWKRVREMQ